MSGVSAVDGMKLQAGGVEGGQARHRAGVYPFRDT
jgi:hypothetical protein